MVGTVIDRKGVFLSVKGEPAFGDTVGIPAGTFACTGPVGKIVSCFRISENHVGKFPFPVRDIYGDDSRAYAGQHDSGSARIDDGVSVNLLSVGGCAPKFLVDFHDYVVFVSVIGPIPSRPFQRGRP